MQYRETGLQTRLNLERHASHRSSRRDQGTATVGVALEMLPRGLGDRVGMADRPDA
jgi:hypothetical protein